MSDSLWPHGLQHARFPCLSSTPGAYSNSCRSSWWCHPVISSSVIPFSSCLQFSPSIRVFSNESVLHIRWPKDWSFSFSISPSLVAQTVKRLPTMRETWVQSLGWEDLLEKEMATHCSILAWKIPWMEEPGRLQSMGSQRVKHHWATSLISSSEYSGPISFRMDWLDLLAVQGTGTRGQMVALSLFQRIMPTQESNQGLLHCGGILYNWGLREAPWYMVSISNSVGCHSILLVVSFAVQKLLSFAFVVCVLVSCPEKSLPKPTLRSIFTMFSSSFMVKSEC